MKKFQKFMLTRNTIIVILCFTIICLSFGFVFLSMKLESYKNKDHIFDVDFLSVRKIAAIKGGVYEPVANLEIDKTGKIIHMDFEFFEEINFEITIKNNGTDTASIVQILSSPDAERLGKDSSIRIHLTDISGKILEPGEETTLKLSAIYQKESDGSFKDENSSHKLSGTLGIIAESFSSLLF